MKIKHQLSIATLVMVGVFATGCTQQSAGGSQVDGGSQVAGGGSQQVAGGGQVSGSQQQVEAAAPVVAAPKAAPAPRAMPKAAPRRHTPMRRAPVRRANPWLHGHPEAPKCAKTRKHVHKYPKTGARHHHRYACQQQQRRVMRAAPKQNVDVHALQRKLKLKGYYKGPIDGVVGPGTRSALKQFMQR